MGPGIVGDGLEGLLSLIERSQSDLPGEGHGLAPDDLNASEEAGVVARIQGIDGLDLAAPGREAAEGSDSSERKDLFRFHDDPPVA